MKRGRFSLNLLVFTLIALSSISCSGVKKLANKPIDPYSTPLEKHPEFQVFHGEQQSLLYLKARSTHYRLTLRAYPDFKSKEIIFEISKEIKDNSTALKTFELPSVLPKYALEIIVTDLKSNLVYHDAVEIDKMVANNQTVGIFLPNNEPLLKSYAYPQQQVYFISGNPQTQVFYIKYYDENYRPAPPPFIRVNLRFNPQAKPKTVFTVSVNQLFTLPEKGLYFIQTDPNDKNGVFLNCFDEDFPKLTKAEDLTLSIRYITQNSEYERLTDPKLNTKLELDNFWLARGGNEVRAKRLIKTYYNRIQLANQFFTSYKEGWKTDRGIIYTIFGPPNRIQKKGTYEYWFYARTFDRQSVEFFFDKEGNDYLMRRLPYLQGFWKTEIYQWRRGYIN